MWSLGQALEAVGPRDSVAVQHALLQANSGFAGRFLARNTVMQASPRKDAK